MQTYWLSKKPPTINTAFATDFKTRRRYKTPKYSAWIAEALAELQEQEIKRFDGDYCVEIYIPLKFRRSNADIDNMVKPTLDLLVKAGATPDDRYLYGVTIRYFDEIRVCIEVKPMPTTPI